MPACEGVCLTPVTCLRGSSGCRFAGPLAACRCLSVSELALPATLFVLAPEVPARSFKRFGGLDSPVDGPPLRAHPISSVSGTVLRYVR